MDLCALMATVLKDLDVVLVTPPLVMDTLSFVTALAGQHALAQSVLIQLKHLALIKEGHTVEAKMVMA